MPAVASATAGTPPEQDESIRARDHYEEVNRQSSQGSDRKKFLGDSLDTDVRLLGMQCVRIPNSE